MRKQRTRAGNIGVGTFIERARLVRETAGDQAPEAGEVLQAYEAGQPAQGRIGTRLTRRQIEDLTASRENLRAAPWQVDDAPPDFVVAQMRGIVGVEIAVTRIEGKWKMSQNREIKDREGVVKGLGRRGESYDADIAAIVRQRIPQGE